MYEKIDMRTATYEIPPQEVGFDHFAIRMIMMMIEVGFDISIILSIVILVIWLLVVMLDDDNDEFSGDDDFL